MLYFKEVPTAISLILYLKFNACQIVLASESPVCPSEVLMFGAREGGYSVMSSGFFLEGAVEGGRSNLF